MIEPCLENCRNGEELMNENPKQEDFRVRFIKKIQESHVLLWHYDIGCPVEMSKVSGGFPASRV